MASISQRFEEASGEFKSMCQEWPIESNSLSDLVNAVLHAKDRIDDCTLRGASEIPLSDQMSYKDVTEKHNVRMGPAEWLAVCCSSRTCLWEKHASGADDDSILVANRAFICAANSCALLSSAIMACLLGAEERNSPVFADLAPHGRCRVVGVKYCRGTYVADHPVFFPLIRLAMAAAPIGLHAFWITTSAAA